MIDFAALQSAVKPKDRTDKYLILSALFDLKACAKPVTAKQVSDLLQLHCGKRAPVNVSASLRAYTAYAQPAAKGPTLLWSLTSAGIDHLRSLSGLAVSAQTNGQSFDYDIGIVCALEYPELAAVIQAVGGANGWKEIGSARYAHVYRE